ncbi:MAG: hypothetical protein WA951_15015 [Leeuwenhoekiella sp.]
MISNLPLAKRMNTVLALSVVFLLVLATNRIDQHHFETAQQSVNEVFEDRVLVQGYIFSISQSLQKKYIYLQNNSDSKSNLDSDIQGFIKLFENTKLTKTEAKLLKDFKADFRTLKAFENQNFEDVDYEIKMETKFKNLQNYLRELSEIQITESKNLTKNAQKSLDLSEFMANMEIITLIVIGILLQILIFYRSKKTQQV